MPVHAVIDLIAIILCQIICYCAKTLLGFHSKDFRKSEFHGLRSSKGRWQAVVRIGKGKRSVVGNFATAEEAARAHDSAAFYLHGR